MRVPKARMSSSASVFEQRGDPWYDIEAKSVDAIHAPSEMDEKIDAALRKHGAPARYSRSELAARYKAPDDPDYDRYFKAKKVEARAPFVDPEQTTKCNDERKKLVSITHALNMKLRKRVIKG